MANSLFTSLLGILDQRSIGGIAGSLGESEQSVSQGLKSSIAAVLGCMASKSGDPSVLRTLLDLAPTVSGDLSHILQGAADPNSPLISGGKRLLSSLFGGSENTVTSALTAQSGLRPGVMSTLMAVAAPIVMSFLGKRVRDEGMTMGDLGSLLQRESTTLRSALPSSLGDLFWPPASMAGAVSPVVAQEVQKASSFRWLPALAIAALGLGLLWLLGHARRPSIQPVTSEATGVANRLANPVPNVVCTLPANVNITAGGAEARLLAFVQNPDAKPAATTWFSLDQLVFETGSAKLRSESQAQLGNIAAILTNCPSVRLEIAGYTDNRGSAEANLRLSSNRASSVVAQLVSNGVSPDRLSARGYGEEYPVADNASEEGRAQNRRVAVRVTQK
jgi:outer membrane protein OmpA-like peptidoglycan-associated protein